MSDVFRVVGSAWSVKRSGQGELLFDSKSSAWSWVLADASSVVDAVGSHEVASRMSSCLSLSEKLKLVSDLFDVRYVVEDRSVFSNATALRELTESVDEESW